MLSHPFVTSRITQSYTLKAFIAIMISLCALFVSATPARADELAPYQSPDEAMSDLSARIAEDQEALYSLELKMGGIREGVNKALVEYSDAQVRADDAQEHVNMLRDTPGSDETQVNEARENADVELANAQKAYNNALTTREVSNNELHSLQKEHNDLTQSQELAQQELDAAQQSMNDLMERGNATVEEQTIAVNEAIEHTQNVVIPQMQADAEVAVEQSIEEYDRQTEGTIFANNAEGDQLRQEKLVEMTEAAEEFAAGFMDKVEQAIEDFDERQNASPLGIATVDGETASRMSVGQRIELIINRGKSQMGIPYAWGGGNYYGPTKGIQDGGVADAHGDYNKIGFDCSGLMMYAYYAIGIKLDHYSGSQYQAGRQVPVSQIKRGDMLFWGAGGSQHVAIYLGDGTMLEAPQSGDVVKISPVRYSGMESNAVRMVE